jgi:hypothetical protein
MASKRQLAANRRNASKSTGPRTQKGKVASSQNSVTHGLTAQQPLLPGEHPHAFDELRSAIFEHQQPDGVVEIQIVERIASLFWRLRRIPFLESALFEWIAHVHAELNDTEPDFIGRMDEIVSGDGPPQRQLRLSSDYADDSQIDRLKLGRMLESALSDDVISKFGRYERDLSRELRHALEESRRLRANRPPGPLDGGDEPE